MLSCPAEHDPLPAHPLQLPEPPHVKHDLGFASGKALLQKKKKEKAASQGPPHLLGQHGGDRSHKLVKTSHETPLSKTGARAGAGEGWRDAKHPNALRASRERAAADAGEVKPHHEPPGSTAVPGGAV